MCHYGRLEICRRLSRGCVFEPSTEEWERIVGLKDGKKFMEGEEEPRNRGSPWETWQDDQLRSNGTFYETSFH